MSPTFFCEFSRKFTLPGDLTNLRILGKLNLAKVSKMTLRSGYIEKSQQKKSRAKVVLNCLIDAYTNFQTDQRKKMYTYALVEKIENIHTQNSITYW